jgi:hypothetical protein
VVNAVEDLSRFRYHTGATLRAPVAGEAYPVLFRDLGPVALARYLSGDLARLAGPLTPLLYMRTLDYVEPYVDYEDIGRIVFLRPAQIAPWHSGIPQVYVARASAAVDLGALAFVPPGMPPAAAAKVAAAVTNGADFREALGGRAHDEARAESLARLQDLNTDLARAEVYAEPVRRAFQASEARIREAARAELERLGVDEHDLCAAWHHLPRERRAVLREVLPRIDLARVRGAR